MEASLRAEADALGIGRRVVFSGYLADTAPALARAQLFVLSSRSEAFPRSILEAMRAGLPVVSSEVGGVSESVRDGETGRLVPPGSKELLADALKAFIKNGLDRQLTGVRGRQTYETRFGFGRMAEETESLYATLVGV
jgi:glycosyltransferase involved in cell wall biosynthesis